MALCQFMHEVLTFKLLNYIKSVVFYQCTTCTLKNTFSFLWKLKLKGWETWDLISRSPKEIVNLELFKRVIKNGDLRIALAHCAKSIYKMSVFIKHNLKEEIDLMAKANAML